MDRDKILNIIYEIYDNFSKDLTIACQKGCSDCCTCNVALTSIEGLKIYNHIKKNREVMEKIIDHSKRKRFIPKMTINRIADYCMKGKEIPEEENDPTWGKCSLLIHASCAFYDERPFGCRCMFSKIKCSKNSYAQNDEFVFTVNHVFMQYIEHIDKKGFSGNLIDMIDYFDNIKNEKKDDDNSKNISDYNLISNSPVSVLMIPPEHRKRIAPILNSLNKVNEHFI